LDFFTARTCLEHLGCQRARPDISTFRFLRIKQLRAHLRKTYLRPVSHFKRLVKN
jgi:hypothetical protein